ncbi:MAG: S8 family serine peptidase [Anaerolineae bacterium]|nr:S8 family serine peptidase [Anaerolineae bacterium]
MGLLILIVVLAFQGPSLAAQGPVGSNVFGVSETGLYIVQFDEPSLASYMGDIAGLAATSPQATGERKFDPQSAASQAYAAYLQQQHTQFVSLMNQTLNRSVYVEFDYLYALNGMAVQVSHAEAGQLAGLPGVAAVYGDTLRELDTDVGPLHINAPAIWDGNTTGGVATRGEGVVIGVIDSGINSQHPSFAATDGDGYTHTNPYGAGVYRGWCVANPSFCNSKLIGAYGLNPNGATPEDTDGHGSHTASTAGGNRHNAIFVVGTDTYTLTVQGVAPRANIVAYKVCNPTCPGAASIQAVNNAIGTDQVDVLNYSISGSDSPWTDPVDLAFLNASNAGIYVAASAGNTGPGPNTVAKTGPWNAAVGASTINRVIANTFDVTAPSPPPTLQGLAAVQGTGPNLVSNLTSPIRYGGNDNGNIQGCTPYTAGYFAGAIALIQRGGCTFAIKVNSAVAAGAVGVVVFNNVGGPPISMGGLEATTVPSLFLDLTDGSAVRDFINTTNPNPTTAVMRTDTALIVNNDWEDIVAGFSARGPSQFEILKPDYIAPGVNILAAVAASGANPVQYGFNQGTSMSSPHAAGAGALLMALHPSWSPAEIKSALASTAVGGLLKEDGATPADPFDIGSGLLNLALAGNAGLVFHETGANYAAANPASGGDPKTLNQPSVANYNCQFECTWTRTVRSVLAEPMTYTVATDGPTGMLFTVTPSTFVVAPGASQVVTITVNVAALPVSQWAFGRVTLEPDNGNRSTDPTAIYDFDGPFAIGNWTFTNTPAGVNGSFNTNPGPPIQLFVVGGNAGTGGNSDFSITIPQNGTISFNWGYQSTDTDCWDSGGYVLNGSYTVLACNNAQVPYFNGSQSIPVTAGDTFAFRVFTDDGAFGAGTLGVTNFQFAPSGGGQMPVSDTNVPVVVRPAPFAPEIDIAISPATQNLPFGGDANFTIVVTNTGDVSLENVTVTSGQVAACDNVIGSLAVGGSDSYTCMDTQVVASYTHTVVVTSTVVGAAGPTDNASAEVIVEPPTSVSLSSFGGNGMNYTPAIAFVGLLLGILGLAVFTRFRVGTRS